MTDIKTLVDEAQQRIGAHIKVTPLEHSPVLSELTGASVYLKLENLQVTGAFKARGAFNRILSLTPDQQRAGVVAASSGNHGAATALAARTLGIRSIIFVPMGAAAIKMDNIRDLGADVRVFGLDGGDTEVHARAYADEHGMTYVSPYNDEMVIAGQGTMAAEIERQLPTVDVVLASVGGGGLISGVAGYLKAVRPGRRAIGVSPRNSMAMAASIRAGHLIETEHLPTLSDGTAGGIEPGAITFDLCRRLVDQWVEVTEDEISSALRLFIESQHMLCEGAAAVAIAGLLNAKKSVRDKNVVVVICGANIAAGQLKAAL